MLQIETWNKETFKRFRLNDYNQLHETEQILSIVLIRTFHNCDFDDFSSSLVCYDSQFQEPC